MISVKKLCLALVCLLATSAISRASLAITGTITGRVTHHEHNQGYCPSSRGAACNGLWYQQSVYQAEIGLSNMEVQLRNGTNTLSSAVTDGNGNFSLPYNTSFTTARVRVLFSSSRFTIGLTAGGTYVIDGSSFTLTGGTQNTGTQKYGTATAGYDLSNMYSAANRAFVFAIDYAFSLLNNPGRASITYPVDSGCPSGAYNPIGNYVCIPSDAADTFGHGPFGGPTRTAHELGHWADYALNNRIGNNWGCDHYDYPALSNGGTWMPDGQEWGCVAWVEGFAMFVSDISRYWAGNAAAADTCSAADYPACSAYFLETSNANACIDPNPCGSKGPGQLDRSQQRRYPLSVMRFLWDAYDTASDGACAETNAVSYFDILRGAKFPSGSANRGLTEWTDTAKAGADELVAITESTSRNRRDGSGAYDFWWNIYNAQGVALYPSMYNNCWIPGD